MIIYELQATYVKKEIESISLNDAESVYNYGYKWLHQNSDNITREHLILICLNRKNFVVSTKILTIGTDNQTLFQPKDIIKHVLLNNCSAFIILHNHPSGDPSPSSADIRVTRSLREACNVMDVILHDHVILGERENDPVGTGFYSFRQCGHI